MPGLTVPRFLEGLIKALSSMMSSSPIARRPVLVLDLGDTVIHATRLQTPSSRFSVLSGHRRFHIQVRPGYDDFIQTVAKSYDIRFFSDLPRAFTLQVVHHIAPFVPDDFCYSLENCRSISGYSVKDLGTLNCPIPKVLLVDDILGSGMLQPGNCIQISPWHGEEEDAVLQSELMPLLEKCANSDHLANATRLELSHAAHPNLKVFR